MKERISERIEFLGEGEADNDVVFNLSATGISFISKTEEKINAIIKVKINDSLIHAKVIYCQKRTDGYRIGLQFWQITPENKAMLQQLVDGFSKGVPVNCHIVHE